MRRIARALRKNKSFLVAGHMNPEGDSLGALIGVYDLLKGMGKRVVAYCNDPPPQNLAFLSRHVKIVTEPPRGSFDAGIIVDSPVLSRLGRPAALFGKLPLLIVIDHHISNARFGHINWVDPDASSSGEMVFRLYEAMKRPRSPAARLAIYTAIVTDTGSFRYENTSARTHEAVARLIKEGVRPRPVSEMIYEMSPISRIKLLGMALNTLGRSKDGRVAWLYVTRAMQKKARAVPGDTEGFV
ncbi:MAG: bifunctional oligoribonuclease/PAP phosphatase NrnA, partial [Firmicutes bacterium]|nr:bifunctional oligoribonuclease/PAP phosphatase NrnA [Bacillota bacterium]